MTGRRSCSSAWPALALFFACDEASDCVGNLEGAVFVSTVANLCPGELGGEMPPRLYYELRTNHHPVPSPEAVSGAGSSELLGDADCGWYLDDRTYLGAETSCHDTHAELTFSLELPSDWDPSLAEHFPAQHFAFTPADGAPGVLELWDGFALDTDWLWIRTGRGPR